MLQIFLIKSDIHLETVPSKTGQAGILNGLVK
jgi:hypothetical protein